MTRKFTGLLKKDLITILVEEFDYKKEDIEEMTSKEMKALIIKEDAEEEALLKPVEKVVVAEERKVKREDTCLIMCGTTGGVYYQSATTGQTWEFSAFGQTDEITVAELTKIRNSHARFFNENWFIILDDEVVKYLGLTKLYENMMKPEDIEAFFDLSVEEIEKTIDKLPTGLKVVLSDMAKQKYQDGTLNNITKIRLIQDKLNVILDWNIN